jgi:hypothetical protein
MGCYPVGVHLTENVPGPAACPYPRKDNFRLIDTHMKCLWPSASVVCVVRKSKESATKSPKASIKETRKEKKLMQKSCH